MSPAAIFAVSVLGLWLLLSLGTAAGLDGLRRALAPLNRFRVFGPWAMFAAGEGRKGAYGLAFRDRRNGDAPGPWTLAATGHHWSWHVFLLDPRRSIADAVHSTGRDLHRHLQQRSTAASAREIARAQSRLRSHLQHLAPPPAGTTREIRVLKHLGPGDNPECEIICQFAAEPDGER